MRAQRSSIATVQSIAAQFSANSDAAKPLILATYASSRDSYNNTPIAGNCAQPTSARETVNYAVNLPTGHPEPFHPETVLPPRPQLHLCLPWPSGDPVPACLASRCRHGLRQPCFLVLKAPHALPALVNLWIDRPGHFWTRALLFLGH